MSDPQNPLFDNEKEFLEQKKLEYERALRGDVEQIKEKTVQVGKVALAGAGLASSIWLITRLLGGRKNRPRRFENESGPAADHSKGKKNKKGPKDPNGPKSAAASAAVFQESPGFDDAEANVWPSLWSAVPAATGAPVPAQNTAEAEAPKPEVSKSAPAAHEPDPFEPQPAPPARPASKTPAPKKALAVRKPIVSEGMAETLGTLAKAAWQSEMARGLFAQAVAAGVAALAGRSAVKSAVEDAQTPESPDLAARADAAAAGAGAAGPFSPAQPSVSDAPRQHPA